MNVSKTFTRDEAVRERSRFRKIFSPNFHIRTKSLALVILISGAVSGITTVTGMPSSLPW